MAKKNRHKQKYGRDYVLKLMQKMREQTLQSDVSIKFESENYLGTPANERLYRSLGMVVALATKPRDESATPEDATIWAGLIKTFAEMTEAEVNTVLAKGLGADC